MVNENAFKEAKEILNNKISIKEYLIKAELFDEKDLYRTLIPCPIHDEEKPSMKIFEDTNSFFCFGCEKGGNVVDLHYFIRDREEHKYSLAKAAIELSRMFRVKIPNVYKALNKLKTREKVDKKEVGITRNKILTDIEKELKNIKLRGNIEEYIKACNYVDEIGIIDDIEITLEILDKIRGESY